jgi:transposase
VQVYQFNGGIFIMGVMQMNEKERLRKAIFEMVKQGRLTLVAAATQCELSYRQTIRIYEQYKTMGDAGLIHQSRGQRSNRKLPHRDAIIARYLERYEGFGPTLAAEYLLEDGYNVDHETLRLWLLSEGLWEKTRKRSPYRQRRERRAQFGELVQIDGSIHDWFGIEKHTCLLNMVDDATGKTLSRLDDGETTRVVFVCLMAWIKQYGIPLALYVDLKTVYVSPKDDGLSHVQIACKKLGIRIIKARSAQAKGRVERNHAVYQDRFVKALKLQGIKTIEAGNTVLENGFIDKLNQKFEKPAQNAESAHRPLNNIDLNQVFCWEYKRQLQHDWTFSFNRADYQLEKPRGSWLKPKNILTIRKHLDGSLSVWFRDEKLSSKSISQKPRPVKAPKKIEAKTTTYKINKKPSYWGKTNRFLFTTFKSKVSEAILKK